MKISKGTPFALNIGSKRIISVTQVIYESFPSLVSVNITSRGPNINSFTNIKATFFNFWLQYNLGSFHLRSREYLHIPRSLRFCISNHGPRYRPWSPFALKTYYLQTYFHFDQRYRCAWFIMSWFEKFDASYLRKQKPFTSLYCDISEYGSWVWGPQ